MTRKTYYYILAFSFLIIPLFFLFDNFIFSFLGIRNNYIFIARNVLIVFIVLYETACAENVFKLINRIAIPIMFIGIMFKIMHWPFGLLLFLVSAITIILVLFISNIKNSSEKNVIFLILLLPTIHLLNIFRGIFHYPGGGLVGFFELLVMLFVGIILAIRLYNKKDVIE